MAKDCECRTKRCTIMVSILTIIVLLNIAIQIIGMMGTVEIEKTHISQNTSFSLNPIPDNYYNQSNTLPDGVTVSEFLNNGKWIDKYEKGGWDCSQMSAYTEFVLENNGVHCIIVKSDKMEHAWVMVETEDGLIAYETTGRFYMYKDKMTALRHGSNDYNASFYTEGVRYESIYDVWEDNKEYRDWFISEFKWWGQNNE